MQPGKSSDAEEAPQAPSTHRGIPIGQLYPSDPAHPPAHESVPEVKAAPSLPSTPVELPEEEPPKNWRQILRDNLSTILLLLLAPLIAWSISAFALQSYQVSGHSMETTLQNNDRLIIDKVPRTWSRITGHQYVPKRGAIIIANTDPSWGLDPGEQIIKRVVGLPGERVVVDGDNVTVYNQAHPEGFHPDQEGHYTVQKGAPPLKISVQLEDNQIFVCGDNRADSRDSRYFGPVPVSNVIGKLTMRVWPLGHISTY